ncbi:MAG: hypothetical protein R2877_04495 [Bdellovibrionota bacterium]
MAAPEILDRDKDVAFLMIKINALTILKPKMAFWMRTVAPENPQDLDGDGILNENDKASKRTETKTVTKTMMVALKNPDDWDGDGILNDKDQCPKDPENCQWLHG